MAKDYADNHVTEAYVNCMDCTYELWPDSNFQVSARRAGRRHNKKTGHEVHYHFMGFSVYPALSYEQS